MQISHDSNCFGTGGWSVYYMQWWVLTRAQFTAWLGVSLLTQKGGKTRKSIFLFLLQLGNSTSAIFFFEPVIKFKNQSSLDKLSAWPKSQENIVALKNYERKEIFPEGVRYKFSAVQVIRIGPVKSLSPSQQRYEHKSYKMKTWSLANTETRLHAKREIIWPSDWWDFNRFYRDYFQRVLTMDAISRNHSINISFLRVFQVEKLTQQAISSLQIIT